MDPVAAPSPWGTPVQRVAQRRNKRDALLVTAARLFKQQGFASASLDQMAAQLGITKPTLYYYVRSKSELVQACALAGFQQAIEGVREALQSAGEAGLEAALKAYARVLSTDFGWCMVRIDEWELPAASAQHMQQQRSILEKGLASAAASVTQVAVWLRALEGVVLSLPKAHVNSLIALLCAQHRPLQSRKAESVPSTERPRSDRLAGRKRLGGAADQSALAEPAVQPSCLAVTAQISMLPSEVFTAPLAADVPLTGSVQLITEAPNLVAVKVMQPMVKKRTKSIQATAQINLF
jgi:AcrR family transcriptional regulator